MRGRNKLYRIDMAHASVAIGFMMRRSREVPCILVSLPADRPEPYLDVDALLDEIGDDAAVLQIVDHETDEWLNSRLPEQLRAYDAATGEELWKHPLPVGASASPMTYVSPVTGKQYVLISVGGAAYSDDIGDYVMAFALKD